MENKELKKLKRLELLEMLFEQSKKIDIQQEKIDELNKKLEERNIVMDNAGSIADAALGITEIFKVAQDAADMYVDNVMANGIQNDSDEKSENNIKLLKRSLRVSDLYIDRLKNDISNLYSRLDEFQNVIKIVEDNIK